MPKIEHPGGDRNQVVLEKIQRLDNKHVEDTLGLMQPGEIEMPTPLQQQLQVV